MEIERKFKLKYVPVNLDILSGTNIEQVYLSYFPEVRLRRSDVSDVITIKLGFGLCRFEYERGISGETYNRLKSKYAKSALNKYRQKAKLGNHIVDIDTYVKPEGLCVTEVEFKTKKEAYAFIPPDWFGEEVTYKREYKNKKIAKALKIDLV